MKCPKCGSKLDTGYNCIKCDYRYRKIEDTTKMTSKQIQVIDGEFMERLTVNKGQEYDGTADMLKVYYRLAEYEDIGTVEDFKDLKAGAENLNLKGDEILLKPFEVKGFVYESEEYKQLKAENESLKKQLENSVQLPCKVGDTVYWLYSKGATGWYNDIRVCKVSSISISEHYIEIHSERTSLNDTNFWGRIGDNVFLTKESAEARLKELNKEVENER